MTVPILARGAESRIPPSITPVLPSWNPMRSSTIATCQGSRAKGHAGEDDHLDERAPDDHRLAAVAIRPDAPERDEWHPEHEEQRAEQPDELEPVRPRDAHRKQLRGQQREDLAHAETFDHRRQPEDGEQAPPVAGAGVGILGHPGSLPAARHASPLRSDSAVST